MVGRVVSTKSKNTATVLIERTATHPLYKKTYLRTKKYLVEDTLGVKDGDIVKIEQCKPISKRKNWKITKVLGQNLAEIAKAQQKEKAKEIISEVMPEASESQLKVGRPLDEVDQNVSESAESVNQQGQQNAESTDKAETPKKANKKVGKK